MTSRFVIQLQQPPAKLIWREVMLARLVVAPIFAGVEEPAVVQVEMIGFASGCGFNPSA